MYILKISFTLLAKIFPRTFQIEIHVLSKTLCLAHSATFSFFHPRRGHAPYIKSLLKRFLNCKYSIKSFSIYVKERTVQPFALGKMFKRKIRDKVKIYWKKKLKYASQACFWLGPPQAEQMAEGRKQLVTALGHRGLQKEMGKLAVLVFFQPRWAGTVLISYSLYLYLLMCMYYVHDNKWSMFMVSVVLCS